jgi:hypothetical protein
MHIKRPVSKSIHNQQPAIMRNETTMEQSSSPPSSTPSSTISSWTYDAGLLVEKGSIVISKVKSSLRCHDLGQP